MYASEAKCDANCVVLRHVMSRYVVLCDAVHLVHSASAVSNLRRTYINYLLTASEVCARNVKLKPCCINREIVSVVRSVR